MEGPTKETATNTAHVTKLLRAMGCETVSGGVHRNRFVDGYRVFTPEVQYGPVKVTALARRRGFDVAEDFKRIRREFADAGLTVSNVEIGDNGKTGSFEVTRTLLKGKTKDGKSFVHLDGPWWGLRPSSNKLWIVEVEPGTDLRDMDLDGDPVKFLPFRLVAAMYRGNAEHRRQLKWFSTVLDVERGPFDTVNEAKVDALTALRMQLINDKIKEHLQKAS
jgi:hypothetical protein